MRTRVGAAHHSEGVAKAVLLLQGERTALGGEAAMREDHDAVAQRVRLLHAMRGEDNSTAPHLPPDDFPCEAAGCRVHAAGGFVQKLRHTNAVNSRCEFLCFYGRTQHILTGRILSGGTPLCSSSNLASAF